MSVYVYTGCLISQFIFFGPLYIPYGIHCQVYPFPSFVKEGILCSVVGHVLKERDGNKIDRLKEV